MINPILLLFPPRCPLCGDILAAGRSDELCGKCQGKKIRIEEPRCRICSSPLKSEFSMPVCADCQKGRPFERCFVPFYYEGDVANAIIRMKFRGSCAKHRFFAREIFELMGDFRPDLITFVPQNRKTLMQRGYNHTMLIAKELGRLSNVPVESTLIRRKGGKRQLGLSRTQRKANAKTLFLPQSKHLSGSCLIVDDVSTTGATLDACCRLLKSMGCEKVYAAAAAKRVVWHLHSPIDTTPPHSI